MVSRLGFREQGTVVHRLNPGMKMCCLILVLVGIMLWPSWRFSLVVLVVILAAFRVAKIHLDKTRGRMRFLLVFSCLVFLLQILVTANGSVLFFLIPRLGELGPFVPVTDFGVEKGLAVAIRFLVVVLSSMLFVSVTDPTLLAYSLTRLGVQYKYAFALVIALRFLPLFDSENDAVRMAQRSRGISIEVGSISKILRAARYTFFPLLVSALSRVEALSLSMDGRGFGYSDRRTYLRTPEWHHADSIVLLASIGFLLLCLLLGLGLLPHLSAYL